jgi:hypothetical protein
VVVRWKCQRKWSKNPCQEQRSLGGGCRKPTDNFRETIGDGLRGKPRGVDNLERECVGLSAKVGRPGGHLIRDKFRLVTALAKATFAFASLAVKEDGANASPDSLGCGGDVGRACLSVEDGYADCWIELIQVEKPSLRRPRLPLLATAMHAPHLLERWHAYRIKVEATHAGKVARFERADG